MSPTSYWIRRIKRAPVSLRVEAIHVDAADFRALIDEYNDMSHKLGGKVHVPDTVREVHILGVPCRAYQYIPKGSS